MATAGDTETDYLVPIQKKKEKKLGHTNNLKPLIKAKMFLADVIVRIPAHFCEKLKDLVMCRVLGGNFQNVRP